MIRAMPYVAKAANMRIAGSSAGKNTGPMMVAKAPYRAKSYHCTAFPRQRADTAVRGVETPRDSCLVPDGDMAAE
jgi:hypothetical protein